MTMKQLKKWKVKYHKLIFGKPSFDLFFDDKTLFFKDNSLQKDSISNEIKINNCIKTTNFEILKHKEKKEGFSENVYSAKTKKKIDFFFLLF